MNRFIYSSGQKILEAIGNIAFQKGIRVYMFHRVNSNPESTDSGMTISVDEFKEFIDKKMEDGFLNTEDLWSHQASGSVITFDDIFNDAYDNAIPYLEEKSVPYICFISPHYLNQDNYISREQLEEMKKLNMCKIGAHSISHKVFRKLNRLEKEEEISCSKHREILGIDIEDFAFPYGSVYACDSESIIMAKKAYRRIYMTFQYPLMTPIKREKGNIIPRINVNTNNYLLV